MSLLQVDLKKLEAGIAGAVIEDAHLTTAVRMFNCKPNDVSLDMRRAAKLANYHRLYGGSNHEKILQLP